MTTYSQTAATKAAGEAKFTIEMMEPDRVVALASCGTRFLDIRRSSLGWIAVRRSRHNKGGFDANSSAKFFKETGFHGVCNSTLEEIARMDVDRYASPAQAIRDCVKRRHTYGMFKPYRDTFADVLADKPI